MLRQNSEKFNYSCPISSIMRGKFFTFEGIDGSGKTTISKMVYEELKKKWDVVLTKEPTDSWLGKSVERAVEEGKDAITISLLFMADRKEHVKEIHEWIGEGNIVLCDRYMDSTFAYQSAHLCHIMDNPLEWLERVHAPFFLKPDKTFLFLIEPSIAISRIKRKKSFFENITFLKKVQEYYILLSKEERFIKLDATESKEKLKEKCIEKIEKEMGL
ncbi:MAG: dTMP kinase [Thermoplasmata archaeon]|nr:MAG: dTMP kinase [Thermoplasmata archaeon]